MALIFRQASRSDIAVIMEIRFLVKENVLSDPSRVPPSLCEDYLDKLGCGWVYERDGVVRGFSFAARADHSIWALFVHPDHEGLGIGSRLLQLAVAWLWTQGATRIKLGTQANSRADRFYAAQGWQRGEMKNEIEVLYTLDRADTPTPAISP